MLWTQSRLACWEIYTHLKPTDAIQPNQTCCFSKQFGLPKCILLMERGQEKTMPRNKNPSQQAKMKVGRTLVKIIQDNLENNIKVFTDLQMSFYSKMEGGRKESPSWPSVVLQTPLCSVSASTPPQNHHQSCSVFLVIPSLP